MTLDIVGFGALNVDKLYRVNRIARENEESFVTGLTESCGGSAANTIVALGKLGLRTGFVGKLADDREGDLHLEKFKKWNIDTGGIVESKEGRSGRVIGFVDQEGERALYIDPGVNDELELDEIDVSYMREAEFLHLTSFVGERPFLHQCSIVKKITGSVKISLDPGILYARKGLDSLKPILSRAKVVLPSQAEVNILTGEDYRKGARRLIEEGSEIVAVKLGEKGCYVTDGEDNFLVEPYKVEVVDTTGAGDAFSAGFLYGLIKGNNLRKCGEIGNFVASKCIEKSGARAGLPSTLNLG
ncbi:hypothetical protein AKJ38_00205 [candidate division MSBL1 archaeon SCGC-AAA259I14]|uniref:Carbohydrate kinase PfkB domain-containing protein n=1 Tax=candidate division MSBL1 archaeon SCGC-AAA259I14 TaxID=1698268 RepID=A0A133UUG9_9EURY|nr:hypothetical protein AKJ38_00205 [candidate division MSBL1 archaeon SCGC-AAA259I14]